MRSADERMTAERDESKYLVPADALFALAGSLSEHLPSHHFVGEGANRLPSAHHFVTTIYFDTVSRVHFRASVRDHAHNVKLRAKEYYDLHPSLAEVATDPSDIVRYQPWLWFELKRRDGARTTKRRFRLPKRKVAAFFERNATGTHGSGAVWDSIPPGIEELGDIAEYCRSVGEPLIADCLVNYRRLSWQDEDGSLRVTVDVGAAFYAPPADLWTRTQALVRGTFGSPCASIKTSIVEVKSRREPPRWLTQALERIDARPEPFSKFVAASRAVHGPG